MERVIEMFRGDLQRERPDFMHEDVHFTEALVRTVLKHYSTTGDVVLDPFAGYGTTLVVSEELDRFPVGIELLADRAAVIRARLGSRGRLIEGDARRLEEFALGAIDLCLTSPPYMNDVDHPQNPLSGYRTMDGHYETYLAELLDVFLAVKRHLRPGGYLASTQPTSVPATPSLRWRGTSPAFCARILASGPRSTFAGTTRRRSSVATTAWSSRRHPNKTLQQHTDMPR